MTKITKQTIFKLNLERSLESKTSDAQLLTKKMEIMLTRIDRRASQRGPDFM